jgi:hypothetical protein
MGSVYSLDGNTAAFRVVEPGEGLIVKAKPGGGYEVSVQAPGRGAAGATSTATQGVFAPRLHNGTASFVTTAAPATTGTWHRTGNVVHWTASIGWTTKPKAWGGQLRLIGLPFAAAGAGQGSVTIGVYAGIVCTGRLAGHQALEAVTLYDVGRPGTKPAELTDANFLNEGFLEISGFFITDQ